MVLILQGLLTCQAKLVLPRTLGVVRAAALSPRAALVPRPLRPGRLGFAAIGGA